MTDDAKLTDREMDVMSIRWRVASGTVAEVRKELEDRLAYITAGRRAFASTPPGASGPVRRWLPAIRVRTEWFS